MADHTRAPSEPHIANGGIMPSTASAKATLSNNAPEGVKERSPSMAPEFDENTDEETRLKYLTSGVRDQEDLERDIGRQADQLLTEQADERDKKRLEKTEAEIKRYTTVLNRQEARLKIPAMSTVKNKIRQELADTRAKIESLEQDLEDIQARMNDRHKAQYGEDEENETGGSKPLPNESHRDFLIRTGKITPFSNIAQAPRTSSNLADAMLDAEAEDMVAEAAEDSQLRNQHGPVSHRNLMRPGFADDESSNASDVVHPRPAKRRRITPAKASTSPELHQQSAGESPATGSDDAFTPDMDDRELTTLGDSEDGSDEASEDDYVLQTAGRKRRSASKKAKAKSIHNDEREDLTGIDDGNEQVYKNRLRNWIEDRSAARNRALARLQSQNESGAGDEEDDEEEEECYRPHPTRPDTELDGGLKIPGDIYPSLFDYQKTGVQWLSELYAQHVGGIVGDEMGLGKTIQVISLLAGLHYSKKLTKPIIVVTPATVMKQWVNEFHRWWPPFRVSILHTTGSGMLNMRREEELEDEIEWTGADYNDAPLTKHGRAAKKIVDKVKRDGHVLVTTYSGLQTYAEFLLQEEWEYAVLDEGHKIRNPNTAITMYCKSLKTPNRVILSGTPIQNNLVELWSLFDFVFPMRLGTLVNFRNQFEFPIKRGGYANASNLEYQAGEKCAQILKEYISPYLLQRYKADVAADLPKKTERVLFCNLTRQQREAYQAFLDSDDMNAILNHKRQMMFGVDYLRKVCNHPDLTEHKTLSIKTDYKYGAGNKSGKMQVVKALLEIWKKGGHKTLLFAQQRIMLDILERFVKTMPGFIYQRMDGNTPIKARQDLVDEFNNNPNLHVFLLTTKVGGLGVNLTGADRVIIYDPDWNPSTDIQARERSWRLGQKREVEIYRLMTAGTIEEKIYHRQIFKQFLTNKVLKDPTQRQTFQARDLADLFTLGNRNDGETETSNLFRGSEMKLADRSSGVNPSSIPTPPSDSPHKIITNQASSNAALEDLTSIRGLHHTEDFRTSDSEEPAESPNASKEKQDDRLLSAIFARSGVHSGLDHDAIMSGNSAQKRRRIQADPRMIEREAKRIAAEAARELQRAGEQARNVPAGIPTWTGQFGTAGRPEPSTQRGTTSSRGGRGGGMTGRNVPSSTSILSNLAARQNATHSTPNSSRSATPSTNSRLSSRELLAQIRDFLRLHGGKVHSQMLVDHFNHVCVQSGRNTAEFLALLRQCAELEKPEGRRGGRGPRPRWVLKEEFRG